MRLYNDEHTPNTEHLLIKLLKDRMIEIITENQGMKETDLAVTVINNITGMGYQLSTEQIFNLISILITQGLVIAIDCQIRDTGCTYLFPLGTQIRTIIPVKDHHTRH
jgi:hypothetical protein